MKLFSRSSSPKSDPEIISEKTSSPMEYSDLTRDLISESKGLVSPPDFSFSVKSDGYIVPHRVNGRKLNWKLYSDVYNTVGIVKNAINNTANFAIQSGYELEGSDREVTKVRNWVDRHNFDLIMLNVMKQMLIYGNGYLEMPSVDDMKLLPVDQMFVKVQKGGDNDGEVIGYVQLAKTNLVDPPDWDPEDIIHFKWNELGTSFYGIPDIRPALTPVRYMLQYLEDIGEIIHRYGHPIIHWRMGSEATPATPAQIAKLISKLNSKEVGEDLVTSYNVESNVVSSNMRLIQLDGLLKLVENQLIGALEVPDFFIRGGETSNRATSQTMLQSFDRRVKALRETMGQIIEDRIFKDKLGTNVKFAWRELSTEGELNKSNIVKNLSSAQGAGIPPAVSLKMVGWGSWVDDYEKEFEKEVKRQAKLAKATKPEPFQKPGIPGDTDQRPEKPVNPPPKEENYENQVEFLAAYEKWLKDKKRSIG